MSKDAMGDRLKRYEAVETARRLDIGLPIYARIDGRSFSRFTRGLRRPFDERMSAAMIETTKHLVRHSGALIGYTQSDEISLAWTIDLERNPLADMFFGGKLLKLASVLAGMATAAFNHAVANSEDSEFRSYADRLPHFDARVFNLPSMDELANAFLWRELDATRNAISMASYAVFPHEQLQGVSTKDKLVMLAQQGIDFDAYPTSFKRGTFVRVQKVERPTNDLAQFLGAGTVIRTLVEPIETPPLLTIEDRPAYLFGNGPGLFSRAL